MAGDDERDAVVANGSSDSLGSLAVEAMGNVAIRHRLAKGNFHQQLPDFLAEGGSAHQECWSEIWSLAAEVYVEPSPCLVEHSQVWTFLMLLSQRVGEIFLSVEPEANERRSV